MASPERLKGIDAFVATADSGSFTAAAARLKITNSAVSKAVGRLEQRLGTRLFNRTTRSLALTDTGAAFYRTCSKILTDLEEAEAVLAAERVEPVGRLRIDLPASYGRLHALPVILAFAREHPRLRPHITFSDHFVDLIEDEVDIVIRIGGPTIRPATLGQRYLGSEKVIFCASTDYLARAGPLEIVADLQNHDCIVYKLADGSVTPWAFKDTLGGPDMRRVIDGRVAVASGEAEVAAVLAGCGVAQLPTWLAEAELARGDVVEVLPDHSATGLPINILWPRSKQLLPKVSLLIEAIAASLKVSAADV